MILSGILDTQLKEMDAVLSQNGFVLLKTLQEGQWVSLLAEKRNNPCIEFLLTGKNYTMTAAACAFSAQGRTT